MATHFLQDDILPLGASSDDRRILDSEPDKAVSGRLPFRACSNSELTSYTAMPYNSWVTFIETSLFTKLIYTYLSDEEYAALQYLLALHPDAGDLVPGSGGVRKLRWGIAGRGKRGGLRIIYYWKAKQDEIWLLTLYAKNEASTIPARILRRIAEEIKNG